MRRALRPRTRGQNNHRRLGTANASTRTCSTSPRQSNASHPRTSSDQMPGDEKVSRTGTHPCIILPTKSHEGCRWTKFPPLPSAVHLRVRWLTFTFGSSSLHSAAHVHVRHFVFKFGTSSSSSALRLQVRHFVFKFSSLSSCLAPLC
jgi:hypothetical protein